MNMQTKVYTAQALGCAMAVVMVGGIVLLGGAPLAKAASSDVEVAGWIPWWQDTMGLKSATKHIKKLDTVYPFAFEVTADGKLVDKANLSEKQWRDFIKLADKNDVEVIPSVMWFDGQQIDAVLSNKKSRDAHIKAIVSMVEKGKYDGVNIDYEGKKTDTIDDFSLFLKDLNKKLGKKLLTCAIEARTPPEDLYVNVPNPLRYANDYSEIARHCDRIELMTYDQQRADLTLNKKRQGVPYAPVADDEWVEKVVELALKDFDENKVLLGIPTYGRAWDVTVAPDWYRDYLSVAALNHPRLLELAKEYDIEEGRTVGGDAVITYFPKGSPYELLRALPVPKGTPKGFESAAQALTYATLSGQEVSVRFASYSDATTAKGRVEMAKEYGLRGVAFFKIDGEEDQKMWSLFR
jgi:spore germination protein YaaH